MTHHINGDVAMDLHSRCRLLVALTIVPASAAAAQVPRPAPDSAQMAAVMANAQRMQHPAQFVLDNRAELALTPDQVQRLTILAVAQRDSIAPRQARLQEMFRATMSAGSGMESAARWTGPIDEEQIRESARRQSVVQAETMLNMARDRHAAGDVLTPQQAALLPGLEANGMIRGLVPPSAAPGLGAAGRGLGTPYFEFQVEKRVAQVPNGVAPRYPDALRASQTRGDVLVQFVVDAAGRVEPESFKVLRSTNSLFTDAVKAALPQMEFTPAELEGKKVRQLVQMPFFFSVTP